MAEKAKKQLHPMPKLGFSDQCLYWLAMILTGGGGFAVMIASILLQKKIAFADEGVVAFAAGPYQARRPIFGRKGVKYGPPAYPRIYPLLMKDKPKFWVSPKKQAMDRKLRRIMAVIAVITLLLSLTAFRRSLYGREVLYQDGTVAVYSPGNRETEHYRWGEISAVELDTYYHRNRKSFTGSWSVVMRVRFSDGRDCHFTAAGFEGDWTETLNAMLALKAQYGRLLTISGTEHLTEVIYDRDLTDAQAELLFLLFDTT